MQVVNIQQYSDFASQKMVKHNLFTSERMFCDVYCLEPAQFQRIHSHAGTDKIYYVIEGTPTVEVDGERQELGAGHAVWAPAGLDHGVMNNSPARARLLVFMAPHP